MLENSLRFASKYSDEDKKKFEDYIASRLAKIDIPNKDNSFLRERMLTMYANPTLNHYKTTGVL